MGSSPPKPGMRALIRTLLFAGSAAFVGKKLYDKGVLDPYIDEARKQLKQAFPKAEAGASPRSQASGDATAAGRPVVSKLPPRTPIPAGRRPAGGQPPP